MYNTEHFVKKCIESCLGQNLDKEAYEIIIVNDGSIDNSLALVNNLYGDNSVVKIVSQNNKGLSGARNTGLKKAIGTYVWFVDSDDWIESNCLNRVTELCEKHDLDILQFCAANIINGKPERRFRHRYTGKVLEGKEIIKNRIPFCAPFSIYKRDFLINNNLWFYEGIFHEDNEFTPRVFYKAKRVEAIDDILYYVYQNPNSITRTVNPQKSKDCFVVMNSLHNFSKGVDEDCKQTLSNIITSVMNVALNDSLGLEKSDKIVIADLLKKNRHLLQHMRNSSSWVYRVEAMLLGLFKKHPIEVYSLLNSLDYRSVKKQEV